MVVVGYLDVSWLSPGYYHNERSQIIPIAVAGVVLVVVGVVTVVTARAWREPIKARIGTPAGRLLLSRLAGATVIVAFLVLLSRPWWMTTRGEFDNLILRVAQQAQDLPVDGTRLYFEYTVHWQAMYFGWPTVILAVLGYVLLLYQLIRRKRLPAARISGYGVVPVRRCICGHPKSRRIRSGRCGAMSQSWYQD
jgi:uncharacterized protein YjeT (DUF2065 family)